MKTIHIQKIHSWIVTEVTAETIELALWASAHSAYAQWHRWTGATFEYRPESDMVKKAIFTFEDGQYTIYHVYGERFTAVWEEK